MGRKGGLAGLAKEAKARKKKAVGLAVGARGKSPADAFLAQFNRRIAEKRQAQEQQEAQEEVARANIRQRLQAAGKGGSLFGRLFGA